MAPLGFVAWCRHLLYLCHSIERASIVGAAVFFGLVGVSAIYGNWQKHLGSAEWLVQIAQTLTGVAGVIGGAAGILFALIVFGIQFHAGRLDDAAFLVRYIRRSEGLLPIAAFTLGLIGANIIVPLIAQMGLPHAAIPLVFADFLLVPLALWLVLWLLYRMAATVSADFYEEIRPSITWEYERGLDEDIHHAMQLQSFDDLAEDAGLEFSTIAGWINADDASTAKIPIPRTGVVGNVCLPALISLGEYVRSHCPDHDASLNTGPGDKIDESSALVLTAKRDDQGRRNPDAAKPPEAVQIELSNLLRRVYRVRPARDRDLPSILNRFESVLIGQAKRGAADELERGLKLQEELIAKGVERSSSTRSTCTARRKHLPDLLGGFTHFDMAANAVSSGDRDTVSALFSFACHGMITGIGSGNPSVYRSSAEIIEAIYLRAIEGTDLADFVGSRIDDWLGSLCHQFKYTSLARDVDLQRVTDQIPLVRVDLGWRLRLIKAAINSGRETDALNFQDRVFRWDEHLERRFAGQRGRDDTPAPIRESCDLASCAVVVLAAWCLHLVESGHQHSSVAKALYHRCAASLGSRHDVLRVWEAVRAMVAASGLWDDFLGVSHWTSPSPTRTGIPVAGFHSDSWIDRGFLSLLICRPDAPRYRTPAALADPPVLRPKEPDQVRADASSLASNESVRNNVFRLSEEQAAEAVDAVSTLLSNRLRLFKLARLRRIVAAPACRERLGVLKTEISEMLPEKRSIDTMLRRIGVSLERPISQLHPLNQLRTEIWKDWLAKDYDGPTYFGDVFSHGLADRENMLLYHVVEQSADVFCTVTSFDGITDAIRVAREHLQRDGFRPNAIFVPRQRRYLQGLTDEALWNLPKHHWYGNYHMGDWEGLSLLQYPYDDYRSIVVVDTTACYGTCEIDLDARLVLFLDDRYHDTHEEWVREAENQENPKDIPEGENVRVVVTAALPASLGIKNPRAALRIDLAAEKLGYALTPSTKTFHRPDCAEAAGAQDVTYALVPGMLGDREGWTACESCHADDYDDDLT